MSAKINESKLSHKGRVFSLFTENITLANGTNFNIDIIRHPGASAIVPLINENTILLLKQYRHAIGDYIWEIPAGTLSEGEHPLECAKRELTEETGFIADIWEKLGEIIPVPGYSDECIHIFLAKKLKYFEQKLDKDEMLDVHEINFNEAFNMISSGKIRDAKTITGLFMALKEYRV